MKANKQVLVICQRPPYPPNKGEKLRTYYQIQHLVEQGCEVTIACPAQGPNELADLKQMQQVMAVKVRWVELKLPIVRKLAAFVTGRSISEQYFFNAALKKKIKTEVEQTNFDAILLTASSLINYVEKIDLPLYMDFMDLDSDKWQQYAQTSNALMRWVYNREAKKIAQLEQRAAQWCTECYFISDNEIEMFSQRCEQQFTNIKKIANGIADDEFNPPKEARRIEIGDDPKLVFVGVMDYKPNEDAVIWFVQKVWPQIKKKYHAATFSIVGMNPSAAVTALSQTEGVSVTGKVDSVLPYFHQADLFVAPFRLARGVQNKILQAFACGLPVVTTPMGLEGIQGSIERCALTATAPNELASATLKLLDDYELRQSMSEQGAALIQHGYAWQSVLKNFMPNIGKAKVDE